MDDVIIALDYFDGSINRVAAWVLGLRNLRKALLSAMLTPHGEYKKLQDEGKLTELLVRQEELKTFPLSAVWDEYCERCGVPTGTKWFDEIEKYEKDVLLKR